MLKITEELNDTLKKDNFILKERNESLEEINTNLMDEIITNNSKIDKVNIKNYDYVNISYFTVLIIF